MNHGRYSVVLAGCAAVIFSACGQPRVRTPQLPGGTMVTLLPDPDSGVVGKAVVSNAAGAAELDTARASTQVTANRAPGAVTSLGEAEATALFGDVLSALPPPPHHFTLYFEFESDALTAESQVLVPQVLQAVKDFPFAEVVVIGHTDTTGAAAANVELGLRRANVVRRLLLDAGLDGSMVEATSHGETDLLVPTADDTFEPRNRRVEISVR